jgi:hypothetical protein
VLIVSRQEFIKHPFSIKAVEDLYHPFASLQKLTATAGGRRLSPRLFQSLRYESSKHPTLEDTVKSIRWSFFNRLPKRFCVEELENIIFLIACEASLSSMIMFRQPTGAELESEMRLTGSTLVSNGKAFVLPLHKPLPLKPKSRQPSGSSEATRRESEFKGDSSPAGASKAESLALEHKSVLHRYVEVTKQLPETPNNVLKRLSHWNLGEDPRSYDYSQIAKDIEEQERRSRMSAAQIALIEEAARKRQKAQEEQDELYRLRAANPSKTTAIGSQLAPLMLEDTGLDPVAPSQSQLVKNLLGTRRPPKSSQPVRTQAHLQTQTQNQSQSQGQSQSQTQGQDSTMRTGSQAKKKRRTKGF